MTNALLSADAALVFTLAVVWGWAGLCASGVAFAAHPRTMLRRIRSVLALVALGALVLFARLVVVALLGGAGWWFVQEKVLLSVPLVLVPAAAVLTVSVRRLINLSRTALTFNGITELPPALRHSAAHPLVSWPIQLTAYGAVAGVVVLLFVGYPVTAGSWLAVVTGVAMAAVVTWRVHQRRQASFAGDVVFPRGAFLGGAVPTSAIPAGATPTPGMRLVRGGAIVVVAVVIAAGTPVMSLAVTAPRDGTHADAGQARFDLGGGPPVHRYGREITIDDLRGRHAGEPVRRFSLTAQRTRLHVPEPGGRFARVDALTFNGSLPGPELRVREGDFVEVTLRNKDVSEGVTIHWHGYDVPAGEDGVAGVTQDAVGVGEQYIYRFRADQVGTFWYHSHQRSYEQVAAGLFGVLVVTERAASAAVDARSDTDADPTTASDAGARADLAVPYHRLAGGPSTILGSALDVRRHAAPGAPVRLRLINAANTGTHFVLRGAHAAVGAIDGTDLIGPTPVANPGLRVGAGGRADLEFTMPAATVVLEVAGGPSVLLEPAGWPPPGPPGVAPDSDQVTEVDLLRYGSPAPPPLGPPFDRHFTLVLDQKFARVNGMPMFAYTVNGRAFPEIPPQLVRFGEVVRFTVVNRGFEPHPMHPHGHHVLVLALNGVAPRGSPLWMDTFEVGPGEVWEVALRADNPGIWMDHCHDLRHAAAGMVFHLAYQGVTTRYRMAGVNHPE